MIWAKSEKSPKIPIYPRIKNPNPKLSIREGVYLIPGFQIGSPLRAMRGWTRFLGRVATCRLRLSLEAGSPPPLSAVQRGCGPPPCGSSRHCNRLGAPLGLPSPWAAVRATRAGNRCARP